jgi:hypothetical protein
VHGLWFCWNWKADYFQNAILCQSSFYCPLMFAKKECKKIWIFWLFILLPIMCMTRKQIRQKWINARSN